MRQKHHFTLMEVLIVMTLLAVAASLVGFNLNRMLSQEKFRTSSELVLQELQSAEEIMLILGSKVKVTIEKDPKGSSYLLTRRVYDEKVSPSPIRLDGIHSLKFIDEYGALKKEKIELYFYPHGRKMTKGTLVLSYASNPKEEDTLKKTIVLTGYPKPILQGAFSKVAPEYNNEEFFPKNLRDEFLQNPPGRH